MVGILDKKKLSAKTSRYSLKMTLLERKKGIKEEKLFIRALFKKTSNKLN